jgi:hypothetical protein
MSGASHQGTLFTGLDDPWGVAEMAWSAPAQREHRRSVSAKCTKFLIMTGIFTKEPVDAF